MDTSFNKAVAAGITTAIVALVARYGWQLNPVTISAVGVIVTAVIGYAVGHILVFIAHLTKEQGTK